MTTPNDGGETTTVTVVIPIRNAQQFAARQIAGIKAQTRQPDHVIVIDSGSSDGSPDLFRRAGYQIETIAPDTFDHGATRNLGWRMCRTDLVLYLTHDAIPADAQCFERLCERFVDPSVAIATGRQLPRREAKAIERHARLFNYPATSNRRTWPQVRALGIRAIFTSNSFTAYRRDALQALNGFPERVIFGEDQVFSARALLNGWAHVYAGDAAVEHSHGYTPVDEFRRYFDIGVSHHHNRILYQSFRNLSGEGKKFVLSELRYLKQHAPHQIPEALLRTALKLLGYHLGKREAKLPAFAKRHFAMQPSFFAPQPYNEVTGVVR